LKHDLENVDEDSKSDGKLLKCLQKYYSEVKTKRQLNMNTPAGFRQTSNLQQLFKKNLPPARTPASVLPVVDATVTPSSIPTEDCSSNDMDHLPSPSTNISSPIQCRFSDV